MFVNQRGNKESRGQTEFIVGGIANILVVLRSAWRTDKLRRSVYRIYACETLTITLTSCDERRE
jgi:hypothetical protein